MAGWTVVPNGDTSAWKPVAKPSVPEPEQPGLLENLGRTFGITHTSGEDKVEDLKEHPIRAGIEALGGPTVQAAEGLWSGGKRMAGEIGNAAKSAMEGNAPGAASHAISAIPFAGPALDKMSDESPASTPGQSYASRVWADTTPGNVGTAAGTAAQIAPALLGGLDAAAPDRPLAAEIPTRAKAGKVFESVMKDAGNQPVNLTRSMEPLERAQQLSSRGGGTVAAADNLYKRVNTVNPLDYREARDWAFNLSRISAQDKMSASPSLRAEVGRLSHAFNEDIGDTAASVGRGEDYAKAMRDYRRASQMGNAAKSAFKWAVPVAAGGGALGYGIKKVMQ